MENNTENLNDTIQDNEPVAEAENDVDTSVPQDEEAPKEADASASNSFLVRYNHEDRELTQEEAIAYAQKGLKFDDVAPMLDQISYLASIKGKGAKEWLDEHIKAVEDDYRASLEEKYEDEDVINLFMEKFKTENEAKYAKFKTDKANADKQAEDSAVSKFESRLADEFIELQKEFPEYTEVKQIPADVLKLAKKGTNLTDAVLRYKHQQSKRVDSARQTAQSNASASGGTMSGDAEQRDSIMEAFCKGLR